LKPYLPASSGEPEFYSDINFSQMETGLSNTTIARLMGISSKPTQSAPSTERPKMSESTRQEKLDAQRRDHPFHEFVGDVLILKSGLIDKKKGLFARRRMFLLTENGRLLYIDPSRNTMKGEVPLSKEITTEAKNFRTFFIHTVSIHYCTQNNHCF
jgi:3-phosphoinositide dependent protein kinase-1